MSSPGRLLIFAGVVLLVAGILLELVNRLPFRLGRLPGDILVRGKQGFFYFPLATCLLLSLVVSLVFWLVRKR